MVPRPGCKASDRLVERGVLQLLISLGRRILVLLPGSGFFFRAWPAYVTLVAIRVLWQPMLN